MLPSQSTGARGFAFSADAFIAVTILAGVILFAASGTEKPDFDTQTGALSSDILQVLENNGSIAQTLDSNSPEDSASIIRQKILESLPDGFDANVSIFSYYLDQQACNTSKTFASCFPDSNKTAATAGSGGAENYFSGQKFYLRKQPAGDCNIDYAFFSSAPDISAWFPQIEDLQDAPFTVYFSAQDITTSFDVNVIPSNEILCDQNVRISLGVTTADSFRELIDMALIMDKSANILPGEKTTGIDFINHALWVSNDRSGLISYDTDATRDQPITANRQAMENQIGNLAVAEGNAIADAILAANDELQPPPAGHGRIGTIKFEILLADGTGNEADANDAAIAADALGIRIFTVGYGPGANQNLLRNVAQITGGEFYYADDNQALSEVYDLIAGRINASATDSNVTVPLIAGATPVDLNGGTIVDGNIVFNSGAISPSAPWNITYTLNFGCMQTPVCSANSFVFPGEGSVFAYKDSDGDYHDLDFDVSQTIDFSSTDLNVDITGGSVLASNKVSLDVKVKNVGALDSNSTDLGFYLNSPSGTLLRTLTVPQLCSSQAPSCQNHTAFFNSTELDSQGVIYARINDDNSIPECPSGNTDAVNCYGGPSTYFHLIKYSVWRN